MTTANILQRWQHGCCVPNSCVEQDAEKILKDNNWCYQLYIKYFSDKTPSSQIVNVCEPIPRQLNSFGPLLVIIIFCVFLLLIIISSSINRYYIECKRIERNENCKLFFPSLEITH